MIHDTLAQAALYHPLGPRFRLGLDFLARLDPATADGRVPIDGDNVFALVQSYETKPPEQHAFEAHRIHADIQFVIRGQEAIYYSPLASLSETTPYSEAKDIAFYAGGDDCPLIMLPGAFAILNPQDGHKPCCIWRQPSAVKKVVIKVRL
jgi:biofilm protein TabA